MVRPRDGERLDRTQAARKESRRSARDLDPHRVQEPAGCGEPGLGRGAQRALPLHAVLLRDHGPVELPHGREARAQGREADRDDPRLPARRLDARRQGQLPARRLLLLVSRDLRALPRDVKGGRPVDALGRGGQERPHRHAEPEGCGGPMPGRLLGAHRSVVLRGRARLRDGDGGAHARGALPLPEDRWHREEGESSPRRGEAVSAPRAAGILSIVLLAPWSARAQDEIDAALAHAREGRKGEAEAILKKVLDAKPPAHVLAGADLVRAEILRVEADFEKYFARFQELMDRSIDLLRSCLRDAPPGSWAAEARRGLDWRLHRKADRAARAFRSEADPQKAALLKRSAEDLYDGLERHYKERARGSRGGDDEGMEVVLDLARSWLDRSRLVSTDDESRRRILGEAIARLQDFQFDHFDSEMSYEALLLEGQCHTLLGDAASAKDRFTGAASLEKRLEESGTAPASYHRGIIRSASFLLTENAFETGSPREVVAIVERAFAKDAELAGPPGHALRIQKAEALFQLGDLAGAHALATEVIHAESDGPNARAAREK